MIVLMWFIIGLIIGIIIGIKQSKKETLALTAEKFEGYNDIEIEFF